MADGAALDLLETLAARMVAVAREHPLRVAIDGVDAAGKTTLADALVAPLERRGRRVVRASIDGFHRPARVRHARGRESPAGYYRDSFDLEGLRQALLAPLGPGGSLRFRRRIFDFRRDAPVASPLELADRRTVLVFDGVFLLRPELRGYWDFSIFVRADFAVTVARAEARDRELFGGAAGVRRLYASRYVPGQELYLAEAEPERHASMVVDNDDPGRPRIVMDLAAGG